MAEIVLIGNPNCGKTTLFNLLTGTYHKVGNFPGVTTEKKEGFYKKDKSITVVDLPGIYSLDALSDDEKVVVSYLKKSKPDLIVNVLDGTNLARNLYLTCELAGLDIPMVLAVNFSDDLDKNGIILDSKKLSSVFDLPVVKISALKNINTDLLISEGLKENKKPKRINAGTDGYYGFIDNFIDKVLKKKKTKAEMFTEKADKIIMNKYIGIPIFFAIITLVYFLSFVLTEKASNFLKRIFDNFAFNTACNLEGVGVKEWIISLVYTILNGFSAVICFLPQLLALFFFMTIIEESGYSARVAFLFDRLFLKIGLSGKSLLPLSVSCGCSVTGIMATRVIENESERYATIFLSPFMPCGAKMALFSWFSTRYFNGNPLVASSCYFLGLFCVGFFGWILKRLRFFKSNGGFLLEIPTLRLPSVKDILCVLVEKFKDFTVKAGTVMFALSVLLWLSEHFSITGYVGDNIEKSFIFGIGNILKYIFYPLGFCSWETAVASLSGLLAREAVIETLEIVEKGKNLFDNVFCAYSFMTFCLLSPPCISSLSVARKEIKNNKVFLLMIAFQFISAYLVAFVINITGKIITNNSLIIFTVFAIILIVVGLMLFKNILAEKCCEMCKRKTKF